MRVLEFIRCVEEGGLSMSGTQAHSLMRFGNKVALVTGTGAGIGRATALEFAREGARVTVADWNDAAGNDTVAAIRAQGGDAHFVKAADDSSFVVGTPLIVDGGVTCL